MIVKTFHYLKRRFPAAHRFVFSRMYNHFAGYLQSEHWRFMNYGFDYSEGKSCSVQLDPEDEEDRYCFQLYEQLLRQAPVNGQTDILEVGSGRGGGALLTQKYFKPRSMTGMDLSQNAVDLCNQRYKTDGLHYVQGDAIKLPFEDNRFDVVINVESSHVYASFPKFISEVTRVLKPGGLFLITDFRMKDLYAQWLKEIDESSLQLLKNEDILENVISALEKESDRKEALINKQLPSRYNLLFSEFAALRHSRIFKDFRNREYRSMVLQKPLA